MATFVLVHPSWFGGWCWKKVTPILRGRGHEVCSRQRSPDSASERIWQAARSGLRLMSPIRDAAIQHRSGRSLRSGRTSR
jgi:hypothetical protein